MLLQYYLYAFDRCTVKKVYPDIFQQSFTTNVVNSSVLCNLHCYLYRVERYTVKKVSKKFPHNIDTTRVTKMS